MMKGVMRSMKSVSAARVLFLLGFCFAVLRIQPTVAQETPVSVKVSLPDLIAFPGDTLEIPVEVSDVVGLNITSFGLQITYDARIVTALRVLTAGTMTDRWIEAHRVGLVDDAQDTLGIIRIGLATGNRIPSDSGAFLKVVFAVSDTAKAGQVSALAFVNKVGDLAEAEGQR